MSDATRLAARLALSTFLASGVVWATSAHWLAGVSAVFSLIVIDALITEARP